LSIDRERIIAVALAGFATPAAGPVPPANPLALDAMPRLDTLLADALLDAAGWRRRGDGWRARGGPLRVELLTVGSSDNELEQLIQADLAARGVRVEIRQLEMAAFLARARSADKDFDVLMTGIPGDLSLAYVRAMYESGQRGGTLDYSDYHDAALDRLFALAAVARSDVEARQRWLAIQRHLADVVPAAWIYHSRGLQGVSSRMRNVRMDLRGEMATVARWTTAESADLLAAR
jgi:peptide/nickel transport system substrate-binding protein